MRILLYRTVSHCSGAFIWLKSMFDLCGILRLQDTKMLILWSTKVNKK